MNVDVSLQDGGAGAGDCGQRAARAGDLLQGAAGVPASAQHRAARAGPGAGTAGGSVHSNPNLLLLVVQSVSTVYRMFALCRFYSCFDSFHSPPPPTPIPWVKL